MSSTDILLYAFIKSISDKDSAESQALRKNHQDLTEFTKRIEECGAFVPARFSENSVWLNSYQTLEDENAGKERVIKVSISNDYDLANMTTEQV